ncbi:hypothetical protein [Hyphomicrobium sp.]
MRSYLREERAWHYGPPEAWQIRHAFAFLAGYPSLQEADSVVEGHTLT